MEEKPKKLLILLTTGPDTPIQIRSALMFASIGAAMGCDTTLYCAANGADAMLKTTVEKDKAPTGRPTIKTRLEEATKAGVKVQVCEAAVVAKGIKQEDLVDQAEIAGAAVLIDLALDSDAVLCF